MIKQIGLPLRGRPVLLIARMITDRIELHSVLLPLLMGRGSERPAAHTPAKINRSIPPAVFL